MRARPPWVLGPGLLAAGLALAGCGGGESGSAEQTVRDFVKATNERDADRVCDELVSKEFVEQATLQTGSRAGEACKQQIRSLKRATFKLEKIEEVDVKGDTARVRATLEVQKQPQTQLFRLKKQDGDWRLTGGPAG